MSWKTLKLSVCCLSLFLHLKTLGYTEAFQSLKAQTHQTDIKELAVMKADCYIAFVWAKKLPLNNKQATRIYVLIFTEKLAQVLHIQISPQKVMEGLNPFTHWK